MKIKCNIIILSKIINLYIFSGSQNNLNLGNGVVHTNENHGLVRKVQNNSPTAQRKPMVSLLRPLLNICFEYILCIIKKYVY